jgi:uroporphyrinogen decarboxylase
MNSMERTLTTLGQKEPDRVPLFLLTNMHGAKETGLSLLDYYARADNVIEGQMRLLHKYGGDCALSLLLRRDRNRSLGRRHDLLG